MNLYLPETGSKVNGLKQPIHHWRVHCHLFNFSDGLGGGGEKGGISNRNTSFITLWIETRLTTLCK